MVFLYNTHESTDSVIQKASAQHNEIEDVHRQSSSLFVNGDDDTDEEDTDETETATANRVTLYPITTSYYGGERHNDFHGKKMANGERFNKNDPTIAASNEFPLGTKIQVINVENGKSAVLTVKDRGGFEKYGRKLDVSRAAAQKLGFIEEGLAQVKILVIKWPKA